MQLAQTIQTLPIIFLESLKHLTNMYLILIRLSQRIKILLKTKEDFLMINSRLAAIQLKNIKVKKKL